MTDAATEPGPPPAATDMPVAAERVWVRMYRALDTVASGDAAYRGLLGDCFLIGLEGGGRTAHILIDCGMLLGSPQASARMHAVATSIATTCGYDPQRGIPGTLDLLVVTHEHWDHISGFSQAADVFFDKAKLAIGKVWMAWTEDPADDLANALRLRFDKTGATLSKIATRVRAEPRGMGIGAPEVALDGLDAFMGLAVDPPATDGVAPPPRLAGRDVLATLKTSAPTEYRRPGEVETTPGPVFLNAYVLGPPHDQVKLFKDLPSKQAPETYLDAPTIDGQLLQRFAEGENPDPSRDSPFAPDYCRYTIAKLEPSPPSVCGLDPPACSFVRTSYYSDLEENTDTHAAAERRRVDGEWLGTASAMALKLDSDTNNTSLVLALELPNADKDVLLFAADAQVGNWQSWHDQSYPAPGGGEVTAADLLRRTRLYKVGHHGSHNATLSKQGLELMVHPRLFAMIPTDEEFGKQQGGGWQMPNPRVNSALREKTGWRILRNDKRYKGAGVDRQKDPETRQVPEDFLAQLEETDLYLQYPLLP